jgi:aryl-alcohol dehydrogenase-like predicted oxidoreductase
MPSPRVPLVFGTMTIGEPGKNGIRNQDIEEAQGVIDTFLDAGYTALDTARIYGEGTTERVSRLPWLSCYARRWTALPHRSSPN